MLVQCVKLMTFLFVGPMIGACVNNVVAVLLDLATSAGCKISWSFCSPASVQSVGVCA